MLLTMLLRRGFEGGFPCVLSSKFVFEESKRVHMGKISVSSEHLADQNPRSAERVNEVSGVRYRAQSNNLIALRNLHAIQSLFKAH